MSRSSVILHVLEGPWYGAEENAFRAIADALPSFSHVVCLTDGLKSSRFALRTVDDKYVETAFTRLQERCDSVVRFCDDLAANGDLDPYAVVSYNVPGDLACAKAGVPRDRCIVWNFDTCGDPDFTACLDGAKKLYPCIGVTRLGRIRRKPGKRPFTIGFLVDHLVPDFSLDPDAVLRSFRSISDVCKSRTFPDGICILMPKLELLRDERWLAVDDEMARMQSERGFRMYRFTTDYGWDCEATPCCDCSVVFGSARYPYPAMTSAAVHVPVVAVGGCMHLEHGVSCIDVAPDETGKAVSWIASNPDKSSRLVERAFREAFLHGAGFNAPKMVEAIHAVQR